MAIDETSFRKARRRYTVAGIDKQVVRRGKISKFFGLLSEERSQPGQPEAAIEFRDASIVDLTEVYAKRGSESREFVLSFPMDQVNVVIAGKKRRHVRDNQLPAAYAGPRMIEDADARPSTFSPDQSRGSL